MTYEEFVQRTVISLIGQPSSSDPYVPPRSDVEFIDKAIRLADTMVEMGLLENDKRRMC